MIDWTNWKYWPISEELVAGQPSPLRPNHWGSGIKSIEGTIETILSFNLEAIVGFPIRLLSRASALESSADIVATDNLGRIHLFELKKGSFSGQSAHQLEQYLLRHVFGDPDSFLRQAADVGRAQTSQYQVARSVMSALANERDGIVGLKKMVQELGDDHPLLIGINGQQLTQYAYSRLDEDDKLTLVHAALDRHATGRSLAPLPAVAAIRTIADRWADLLKADLEDHRMTLTSERRLVLWLVGSAISPEALERVRLWRRSGVDARAIRMTARSDGQRWTLGTSTELAAQRDSTERDLLAAANEPHEPNATVAVQFYRELPASTNRKAGGELLEPPSATIRQIGERVPGEIESGVDARRT